MTFDTDKEADDEGLDYKDYVRMLLLMESAEHRNYRTMGAMELRMISMGHENFRMKNYVVSAKVKQYSGYQEESRYMYRKWDVHIFNWV